MRAILALFFFLIGACANAQTLVAKTEAGLSFCITCANNASFLPLSTSDMRQLDALMKSEPKPVAKEAPKKVFIGPIDTEKKVVEKVRAENINFDLAAVPTLVAEPKKVTAQERLNQSQRIVALDENKHAPTLYKPRKLKYVYLLEENDNSVVFGLNRNSKLLDPAAKSFETTTSYHSQKNPKFVGLKYQKKFFGFK